MGDIIESVALLHKIRVKNNTPEWFHGEILNEIRNRDKLNKKYKNTKIEKNGILYRSSRNRVQSLINTKKENYIQSSLKENKWNSKNCGKLYKSWPLLKNKNWIKNKFEY